MISKETQREIDKLLIKEIRDSTQKVVDTLYPLQGEILDLLNKVERYAERARRTQ